MTLALHRRSLLPSRQRWPAVVGEEGYGGALAHPLPTEERARLESAVFIILQTSTWTGDALAGRGGSFCQGASPHGASAGRLAAGPEGGWWSEGRCAEGEVSHRSLVSDCAEPVLGGTQPPGHSGDMAAVNI